MSIFTTLYNPFRVKQYNVKAFQPINQNYWRTNHYNLFNKYENFTIQPISNSIQPISNSMKQSTDDGQRSLPKIKISDISCINLLFIGGVIGAGIITYNFFIKNK